jgi:putative membrane protein
VLSQALMRETLLFFLPKINASLNALSGVFLVAGIANIKRGRREVHRRFMLSACVASLLFLVGYLLRVAMQGTHTFAGTGFIRGAYLFILISHMTLAMVVVPLVLRTLYLALRRRFDAHPRIARVTFPIWLYVSVTGVVVYVMLYHVPGYVH